jgi:hypothetical protein
MNNNNFIQRLINENQAKIDSYTAQAASADGDKFEELTRRVSHHQNEINNYKQIQEQGK